MKSLAYLMMICFVTLSCGKKGPGKETIIHEVTNTVSTQDKTPSSSQTIEKEEVIFKVKRKTEISEDLSNYNSFVNDLNKFEISAELKNQKSYNSRLICKEINATKESHESIAYIDQDTSIAKISIELEKDATNLTEFNCKVLNEDKENISETNLTLKKDYIVGVGNVKAKTLGLIDGKNNIGALVIDQDATLTTDGMRLTINATEVISLNGKIETFYKEDLNSPDNTAGASGGIININTSKALGKLSVYMRGKNAGKSTTIDNSYSEFNGSKIKTCPVYNETEGFQLDITWGGVVPPKTPLPRGSETFKFDTQGAQGLPGGDTGSFYLQALKSNLELNVEKIPGLGGRGGETSNSDSSLIVHFYKPETNRWTAHATDRNFIIRAFEGTEFHEPCHAVIRYSKVPKLGKNMVGPSGDHGEERPSCIFVRDSNENECF